MLERKEKIVEFMKEQSYKPLLFEELVSVLDVPVDELYMLENMLDELLKEGEIFKTHRNRYSIPDRMGLISGRIQGNERGYAFAIPNNGEMNDVFIPANCLNGAMHNDKVIARINKKIIGDKRAEGEIIRIIERANDTIIGRFEKSNYFGFVIPDNKKISNDIFIPKDEFKGVNHGQKVIVEIIKWPAKRRNAEGKIIDIIGDIDAKGIDVLSVIRQYNIKEDFPNDVLSEIENIPVEIDEKSLKDRVDLRDVKMVTIDGEDAKDLDDAVSIEKLSDEIYRLGVHIADVSHYVTENSSLDIEALDRGTSVYFVDRVIPMLPKQLSNGICSLNPKIDRLAFSVTMDIDKYGNVKEHNIFESIIKINERMTYTDVSKILEDEDEVIEKYKDLHEDFLIMKELALILREKRENRGAIDFDFDEAKIILDDDGKPIDIVKYNYGISNKIIEEFMLVCNETVAEHFYWMNVPFVYRVHEDPDSSKIENLNKFLKKMGYTIKGKTLHPKSVQRIIEKVKGTKEERIISTVVLRSLQKARYCNINEGHFGLSTEYYCHFTSPIRRYPDLIIHRMMKLYLKGELKESDFDKLSEKLSKIAVKCSEKERLAEEAEREIDDLKKVEYMKEKEGEVFDGIISNITSFGIFVELENTIEGMIKLSSLVDDYYIYSEENYCLYGEASGKAYKIGDSVRVINAKADIDNRRIEFILEDSLSQGNSKKRIKKKK